MPRAFHDEERRLIHARLIEAGKKLINRGSTRNLTVDAAAQEAGISKGSFYSFFPSREDFILSVFESWEDQYRTALLKAVIEGPGSPRERLEAFFHGSFEILEREPGLAALGSGEIERIKEGIPPERLAAHQASDSRVLDEALSDWARLGIIDPAALPALPGIAAALFAIAIHREDFPAGSFGPTTRLLAEALAMRVAGGGE